MTKELVRSFARAVGKPIFYAGYCDLQHITCRWERIGYNSGIYGWNWDCFSFPDFVLVTGYRNLFGTRLKHCEEYNKKAHAILHSNSIEIADEKLMNLVHELFLAQKED